MKRLGGGKLEFERVTIEEVKGIVFIKQLISFKNKGGNKTPDESGGMQQLLSTENCV